VQIYSRNGAVEYLRRRFGFGSRDLLRNAARHPSGPRFCVAGKIALYRESDLDDWAMDYLDRRQFCERFYERSRAAKAAKAASAQAAV
jgi:hypothetical protein